MKRHKLIHIIWVILSFLVALSMVVWSIGVPLSRAEVIAAPLDSLIKTPEMPTIYYYAADGARYVFPNESVYGSWFREFRGIYLVTQKELAAIPLKGAVTYRPGVRMVKILSDPKVYAVDQGGKLRWIRNEELAEKLYGRDWNKKIDDIPEGFFANYNQGQPIASLVDYDPIAVTSIVQTINKDKAITETTSARLAETIFGGLTKPTTPKDSKQIFKIFKSVSPSLEHTLPESLPAAVDEPVATATSTPITNATSTPPASSSAGSSSRSAEREIVRVRDTTPPDPPILNDVYGIGNAFVTSVVSGSAEAGSIVKLYRSSDCSSSLLGTGIADTSGLFTVNISAFSASGNLYANVTDSSGNISTCATEALNFSANHLECPSVPDDLPISRPPINIEWEPYNFFLQWKINPSTFASHQDELKLYPPKLLGPGGFHGQVPFQWGENGVQKGVPNVIYGDWTQQNISSYGTLGLLPPAQLIERVDSIKNYLNQYKGITKYFPYIDFGTQIFGNHSSRTGFWEFYDKWGDYSANFDIGTKPPDPTTWLRRLASSTVKENTGYPDELAGLSFSYSPIKNTYSPFYRYSVNILSQGWQMWWKQVMQWLAKVGYELTFIDNVYFGNCWNSECETEFQNWLTTYYTPQEIAKYFTTRVNGWRSYWDTDFESPSWYPDEANSSYRMNYVLTTEGGTLWPDKDSYHGLYSARLEGPGNIGTATSFTYASGTFKVTVHYKTSPEAQAALVIDATGAPGEPFNIALTPASTWTEYSYKVNLPATSIRVRFKLNNSAKLWVDDIWVSPVVVLNDQEITPYPVTNLRLPYGEETWASWPLARLRFRTAVKFWDSIVDKMVLYLRTAAREVNPNFEVFTNSFFPRRGSDYFMFERHAHEFEAKRQDVGSLPGIYRPGGTLRGSPVLSDTLNTNIFDLRYEQAKRFSDFFGYAIHHPEAADASIYGLNPDSILLNLAELGAFGGGAGRDPGIRYSYLTYDEATRKPLREKTKNFFDFVEKNRHLYACLRSFAEVGLVFHDQPNNADLNELVDLANGLSSRGVIWDMITEERLSRANFNRFKVLIYHDVDRISDNEARLLLEFMNNGGLVIAIGDVGKYNELFRVREFDSDVIWPPIKFGGTANKEQSVGSGKYIYVPQGVIDAGSVTAWIQNHLGRSANALPTLDGSTLSRMRIAFWAGPKRLIAHLVNYNVPQGKDSLNQVAPISNLEVRVMTPGNWQPKAALIYSPESDVSLGSVPIKQNSDGTISFVVPKMRIYSVVEIK